MKKNKNGLYQKQVTINGVRKVFSSKSKQQLMLKIAKYTEETTKAPLFQTVAEDWKEEHWKEIEMGSWRAYSSDYDRIVEQFGQRRVDEITPADVQAFLYKLGKIYSLSSVSNHKTVLNQIFNKAIFDMGVRFTNPCTMVRLPKNLKRGTRDILTKEQCDEILSTRPEEFQLAYLIYFTGLRCGEALALQLKDVDFDRNIITVSKAVHYNGNPANIGPLKTNSSYRQIPLTNDLKARLMELSLSKDDYIVSGEKPLTQSVLARRWLHYCEDHGMTVIKNGKVKPAIDRHQIRHQYTTNLYNAGVDLKSIQRILGHSDIQITLQTYTHLTETQFQKSLMQINEYFA